MDSHKCIWSDFPLSTGIATLVCYAAVFNDVISVEEIALKLGATERDDFSAALDELSFQRRLVLKDGFAALPDLADKIALKAAKIKISQDLINSRRGCLQELGGSRMIKFVGISGSLAASNPVKDRNNHLDLDVFLITRNQCLWFYTILRGIQNLFAQSKFEPELCANYIMDESNLLVTNRNLYTATEIRNLIPVSGLEAYQKFLQVNHWVNYYYPGFSSGPASAEVDSSGNLMNKVFYVIYSALRAIKWLSIEPLKEISFEIDPQRGISFHLLRPRYGGYQAMVQKHLSRIVEEWFPELSETELIPKLFPDKLSAEIRRGNIDVPKIILEPSLGYDYSKYER